MYFLTELGLKLGKDIGEMMQMPIPMIHHYMEFFKEKNRREEKALEAARRAK